MHLFSSLRRRLHQARKLLTLLQEPKYYRAAVHGVAASTEHHVFLRSLPEVGTLIDVGANKGQFSTAARARFPNATIIAFEPLPVAADCCERIFAHDARFRLHRVALGAEQRTMDLQISGRMDSSSLLPIGTAQTTLFPGTQRQGALSVSVMPLAAVVKPQEPSRPLLMKVDVQGYELEALKGAAPLLAGVDYLYVEASFIQLYEGQPLIGDVIDYLASHNLMLSGIYNLTADGRGRPIQADFLFTCSERGAPRIGAVTHG